MDAGTVSGGSFAAVDEVLGAAVDFAAVDVPPVVEDEHPAPTVTSRTSPATTKLARAVNRGAALLDMAGKGGTVPADRLKPTTTSAVSPQTKSEAGGEPRGRAACGHLAGVNDVSRRINRPRRESCHTDGR